MLGTRQKIKRKLWAILPEAREARVEVKRDLSPEKLTTCDDQKHLEETIQWLVRAQDATQDDGVSRAYSAASISSVRYKGWEPSYPETTGYIIPTMLAASEYLDNESLAARAIKMADWEIDIQLSSGAVMGSVVTAKPSPAVFNTGQVILGWLELFKKIGEQKYLDAALKAGDFLVSVQDDSGDWHKADSNFARKGATTYNTRVAWALIELGLETGKEKYITAGRRNVELALTKQQPNGWFADNCLNDPNNPLLHTIVYATRGVLESGICLNDSSYIDAANKALNAIAKCQRENGGIAGRLNNQWQPAVTWDCVTGDAQAAIAWLRLSSKRDNDQYRHLARKAIEFIKLTQNLEHSNLGIKGGIKGSFPFDGEYGQYEMLNWAAKFFCDAIMMINDDKLANEGIAG